MIWLAATVSVLLVVAGLRPAVRDHLRRRAATEGTVAYKVVLDGLPEVVGPARLRVGPDAVLVDDPETHRRYDLSLTGFRLTRQYGDWTKGGERERTAFGQDGRGLRIEVTGEQADMLALWDALHDRALPSAPRPPVAAPARDGVVGGVFVAVAGLIGVVASAILLGAVPVTGIVLEEPVYDGYCLVEWVSPWSGETLRNDVDCWAEEGESVPLLALNTPLRGDVWDEDTPSVLGVIAASLVLIGLLVRASGTWSQRRRARRSARTVEEILGETAGVPSSVAPVSGVPVALPTADRFTYDVARQVMPEIARARTSRRWTPEEEAEIRAARRMAARFERLGPLLGVLPALGILVPAVLIAGLAAWVSVDGLLATRGPSATAQATVADVQGGYFFIWPDDAQLTFTTPAGQEVETYASVTGRYERGATVTVQYAVDAPVRARVVGDGGPERGALTSAAVVLLALLVAVVTGAAGPVRRRLAVARGAARPPHLVPYVLDREPLLTGEDERTRRGEVLLFDENGALTFRLLVVGEGVGRAPGSGTAQIHGELREGAPVRCALGGVEVRCLSELTYADAQEVLDDLQEEWSA